MVAVDRGLVEASGANLASIGYHYGSTEALLNAALLDAVGEVNDVLNESMHEDYARGNFASAWQRSTRRKSVEATNETTPWTPDWTTAPSTQLPT